MRKASIFLRAFGIPMLAGCVVFPAATGILAQDADAQRKPIVVRPTEADAAAAREAGVGFMKAWSGTKPKTVAQSRMTVMSLSEQRQTASSGRQGGEGGEGGEGDQGGEDNFSRVPGALSFLGGAVVESAESHNIYLLPSGTTVADNWGDPETFLRDLGKSEFIHIADQYVHEHASNRYTLGGSAIIPFTVTGTALTDIQMRAIVHAVASATGETGLGHIYHVFLPQGQDECMSPGVCASNVFCAYHGSFDSGATHFLYSVEPFTNVIGCQVRPNTPNGTLIDSTNNVLSHELIETITDPDGIGWRDITSGGMFGQEIGDECVFVSFINGDVFTGIPVTDPAIISVEGRKYALQPEYNNRAKACTAEK
jgi:hypothetical protein